MAVFKEKTNSKPENKAATKGTSSSKTRGASDVWADFWKGPWAYIKRFQILLPHFLPTANLELCLRYAGVLACSFTRRGLNLYIPLQLGYIIKLLETSASHTTLFRNIVLFIFLKFANSASGIGIIEADMWRPIETEAVSRLNIASYRHVMYLSSDYHDNKKSAKTWGGLNSGWTVVSLVYTLSFDLLPRLLDFFLAMGLLWTKYDMSTAFIAASSMISYNWITIRNYSRRRDRARSEIDSRTNMNHVMMETSSNWPTVAYFNRFDYEVKRYVKAVDMSQKDQEDNRSTNMTWNAVQQAILLIGLGSAYMVVASQVRTGKKAPSDFVVFTTYWSQLIGPLTSFVHLFMNISFRLVQTEKLVEIFEIKPSVPEAEDANDIDLTTGRIKFDNVTFGYKEERLILKNVSFQCPPGTTTAIVGETGGGKSTILKVMARFYDATSGSITIDDQDVKKVTLNSLRSLFGHVPQSVGVFNTTILENLQYGKLDATLVECQEACKAAALHDRIMAFPEGYETIVGEKGVKLSGGELQRLAIARVVLQNPKILLLDEATSSVDTGTEAMIQESLEKVSRGRTTIVVAHRLSTIARADMILVVKEGQIVERGTHDMLLAQKGVYYELWTKQEVKKQPSTGKVLQRANSYPSMRVRQLEK